MTEAAINDPWSAESLFTKAQLYVGEMESKDADDWQYGLWSSLSLELLCRAALSNISPVLLADQKSWHNITFALGKDPTAKKFTPNSIITSEVINRLTELLPGMTQEISGFCSKHTQKRNAELHSGEAVFSSTGTSEWLPRFYQACKVLLESMNKELSDYIDDDTQAEKLINSLEDSAAKAVTKDINAHSTVWQNKSAEEKSKSLAQATTWATRQVGHRVQCPSCDSPSLLFGEPTGPVSTQVNDDEVIQKQSMLPATFECIACGLKISGFSKLSKCNLGDAFSEKTVYSAAEFFDLYTEDDVEEARREIPEYEPDFNDL